MSGRSRWLYAVGAVLVLAVVAAGSAYLAIRFNSYPPQSALAEPVEAPDPRDLLRQAVATRTSAIENPTVIQAKLESMPLGVMDRSKDSQKHREAAWSFFFKGTMTKLGRIRSKTPLITYYNPIVDVAVVEGCEYSYLDGVTNCKRFCALPGETLSGKKATFVPEWMSENSAPIETMQRAAADRMAGFAKSHPADARDSANWPAMYCSDRLQRLSESRLLAHLGIISTVDPIKLNDAILTYTRKNVASLKPKTSQSAAFAFFDNAASFSLSGVVTLGDAGYAIFFTPKATGWRQAVVTVSKDQRGQLEIGGAELFSIRTGGDPK